MCSKWVFLEVSWVQYGCLCFVLLRKHTNPIGCYRLLPACSQLLPAGYKLLPVIGIILGCVGAALGTFSYHLGPFSVFFFFFVHPHFPMGLASPSWSAWRQDVDKRTCKHIIFDLRRMTKRDEIYWDVEFSPSQRYSSCSFWWRNLVVPYSFSSALKAHRHSTFIFWKCPACAFLKAWRLIKVERKTRLLLLLLLH